MDRYYRVLHVIDSFGLGGAQEVVCNLVRYCDRKRFSPEVASLHGKGKYYEELKSLGIPVYSLSPHKLVPLYVPGLLIRLLRRRYDVIHCHLIASNLVAKPIAWARGVRVRFNHDHCNDDYRYRNRIRLTLDRLANRLTTHTVAVSQSIHDFLIEREHLPPDRVTTVLNGVDLERFRPRPDDREKARMEFGVPPESVVVAGVGRLNYQKNFSLFLDVAAQVIRETPNTVFVIAGDGPERKSLEARALSLELGNRLRFLGLVRDAASLYPAADVFLLTSHFEGTPMTILEAMAVRVAICASRLDGISEVLEHGRDALLSSPGEKEGFVAEIRRLVADPGLRGRLCEEAYRKVTRQYSAQSMTRTVESLYLEYLKER